MFLTLNRFHILYTCDFITDFEHNYIHIEASASLAWLWNDLPKIFLDTVKHPVSITI